MEVQKSKIKELMAQHQHDEDHLVKLESEVDQKTIEINKSEELSIARLDGLKMHVTCTMQEQFLAYRISEKAQLVEMLEHEGPRVLQHQFMLPKAI